MGSVLALAAAALYLVLPLMALAAYLLRRFESRLRTPGTGTFSVQLSFVAAASVASGVVTVPVTALAMAISPVKAAALWPAIADNTVSVVRLCVLAGLLLVFTTGLPWELRRTEKTLLRNEPGPC
ncbi:hypothetical protein [Streptomyces sp. NPDC057939]|uniref:hypothetical protein n=1 Tax=Streptomyces sp. NPDC057939 TaxID=3346284 RepID=UPI0036ECFAB0